jgi:hypothetical protein
MLKRIGHLIILLIILTLIAGCAKKKDDIIPLKVGNLWIYKTDKYDQNGTLNSSQYSSHCILKDTSKYGETFYLFEGFLPWINKADGLYVLGQDSLPELFLKYPAPENDSYTNKMNDSIIIKKTDEKLNIPSGNFKCYKYQVNNTANPNITSFLYVSPGTGIVQIEDYNKSSDSDSTFLMSRTVLHQFFLR